MYLNFKLSSTHYLENRTLRKLNRKKKYKSEMFGLCL